MTTYSKEWHYENCMGLDRCEHDDPECPHNHFLKNEKCHCPPLLNQKPVDDKELEIILADFGAMILTDQMTTTKRISHAAKLLNAYYQKKYLGQEHYAREMIRLIRYFRKVYFEIARNFEHTESWWNNYRDLL